MAIRAHCAIRFILLCIISRMKKNLATPFIILMLLACGFTEPKPCDVLHRVVVTGASVTAGYGLKTPPIKGDLGGYPINMKHIMEGVITSPHEDVVLFSDTMFFRNPEKNGSEYIQKIIEYKPSLVVGIDFLFWFAYGGTGLPENIPEKRMVDFEYGLELLSKIKTPLIIGNLPDMHSAIGKMLSAHQVPSLSTLKKLNTRLREWASNRSNVIIVNVNQLFSAAMNDEEITVLNTTWQSGSQEKLLQKDMLHTTFEGTVIASLLIVETLELECTETDPKVIMKKAAAEARKQK